MSSTFIEGMIEKAKSNKKKIVLPESLEERNLQATAAIISQGIADIYLVGNAEEVKNAAAKAGADITGAHIVDPMSSSNWERYVDEMFELRKSKGITREQAADILHDPVFYGAMMVRMNEVEGMVSGAIHPTANIVRAGVQVVKMAPGSKVVSGFFIVIVPNSEYGANGTFLFADAAMMPDPNAEELAAIAQSSAKSFESLIGVEPIIAMLSFSTKGSASHPNVDKVQLATKLAKEQAPHLKLDGELQLDAALVEKVGQLKAPGSSVAGYANVLVFPNLDAANIGYKLVQRLAKAEAYGPIMQGLAKPVNDLSRGCSAEDIVGVVAITAVQAQLG